MGADIGEHSSAVVCGISLDHPIPLQKAELVRN